MATILPLTSVRQQRAALAQIDLTRVLSLRLPDPVVEGGRVCEDHVLAMQAKADALGIPLDVSTLSAEQFSALDALCAPWGLLVRSRIGLMGVEVEDAREAYLQAVARGDPNSAALPAELKDALAQFAPPPATPQPPGGPPKRGKLHLASSR